MNTNCPQLIKSTVRIATKDMGVYGILNRNNRKIYIGGTRNMARRLSTHIYDIKHGCHCSKTLQSEVLQDPEAFEFSIIETVKDAKNIISREQFWMDFYKSYLPNMGYNQQRKAGSMLGFKHNEEFRLKVSKRLKGKKRPPRSKIWIKRLSEAHTGKKHPERCKPVIKFSLDGKELARFSSVTEASEHMGGIGKMGGLVATLKHYGYKTTAYGFKWAYAQK